MAKYLFAVSYTAQGLHLQQSVSISPSLEGVEGPEHLAALPRISRIHSIPAVPRVHVAPGLHLQHPRTLGGCQRGEGEQATEHSGHDAGPTDGHLWFSGVWRCPAHMK